MAMVQRSLLLLQGKMADSLVWELIKNNNCFLHKRAHAKRAGAVQLSCEPGNVLGVHSFKYSGVANSKAVDVRTSVDPETNGTVVSLVYKNAKESSKPKKSTSSSVLKVSKGAQEDFCRDRWCLQCHRRQILLQSRPDHCRQDQICQDRQRRTGEEWLHQEGHGCQDWPQMPEISVLTSERVFSLRSVLLTCRLEVFCVCFG